MATVTEKPPRPYKEYRDFIGNSGLTHKDSQERIAAAIRDGIASGRPVIAEGGTGNGKTVSYLVPAIEALHKNPDLKLVVSTWSIALQNQLIHGQHPGEKAEIPRVLDAMKKKYGKDFKIGMNDVTVIVGAQQHLCEESEAFPREDSKETPAKSLLIESVGEQNYVKLNEAVKKARQDKRPILLRELDNRGIKNIPLSVREEISCRGSSGCKHFHNADKTCSFATKMDHAFKNARIIVTNHAQLTMNRGLQMALLKGNIVVIDEANRLPDILTRMANASAQLSNIRRSCDLFLESAGQMTLLTDISEKMTAAGNFADKLRAAIDATEKAVVKAAEGKKSTSVALRTDDGEIVEDINFYKYLNEVFPGSDARDALENGRKAFESLVDAIKKDMAPADGTRTTGKTSSSKGAFMDLIRVSERIIRGVGDLHGFGRRILKETWLTDEEKKKKQYYKKAHGVTYDSIKNDNIIWFEKGTRSISMFAAPLDHIRVQRDAARALFDHSGNRPVFISATLSTDAREPNFIDFERSLGIQYWSQLNKPPIEIQEASDHHYDKQAILVIPNDLPQPEFRKDSPEGQSEESKNYFDAIAQDIIRNVKIVDGNSMVLCSSAWQASALSEQLEAALDPEKFQVLNQVESSSTEGLIRRMRQGVEPKKVLVGTDTLWNGIDLRGEALRGLFIPKAPFAVPDHPVERERARRWSELHGKKYFWDVTLPSALDKMRQGSGRLIRSSDVASEYGVIVFYDPRFSESKETQKRKGYPARVLNAFPAGMPVHFTAYKEIPGVVKDFFDEHGTVKTGVKDMLEEIEQSVDLSDLPVDDEEMTGGMAGVGI